MKEVAQKLVPECILNLPLESDLADTPSGSYWYRKGNYCADAADDLMRQTVTPSGVTLNEDSFDENNTQRVFSKLTKLRGLVKKEDHTIVDDCTDVEPTYQVQYIELLYCNGINCNWQCITPAEFSNFIVTPAPPCKHLNAGSYWLRLGEYSADKATELFNKVVEPKGHNFQGNPFAKKTERIKVFDKRNKLYGKMRQAKDDEHQEYSYDNQDDDDDYQYNPGIEYKYYIKYDVFSDNGYWYEEELVDADMFDWQAIFWKS